MVDDEYQYRLFNEINKDYINRQYLYWRLMLRKIILKSDER